MTNRDAGHFLAVGALPSVIALVAAALGAGGAPLRVMPVLALRSE